MNKFTDQNEEKKSNKQNSLLKITKEEINNAKSNPFKADVLKNFFKVGIVLGTTALISRFTSAGVSDIFKWFSIMINGALSVGMTNSILNYFGYRDYKKTHPGKVTKEKYIHDKTKALKDFETRYYMYGEMHRRR